MKKIGRPKLHEMRWTPTYNSWVQMKARCSDPNHTNWEQYGARGIRVCDRWQTFLNFFADMGTAPPGYTIDRIDNSKGYDPSNCRWASKKEQSLNRAVTHWVEFKGERLCMTDWAARLGMGVTTLAYRLKHWDKERALTTPAP